MTREAENAELAKSARRWLDGSLSSDRCPECYHRMLAAGLDALAREPLVQAGQREAERLELKALADLDEATSRIAALEALLARMTTRDGRELTDLAPLLKETP